MSEPIATPRPRLATLVELAPECGVSYSTLAQYSKRPGFPEPAWTAPRTMPGRAWHQSRRIYYADEVLAWVRQHRGKRAG